MAKRKKGQQREGVCVYCGAEGPITDEHVFARRLFEELDDQMVTVPACGPCNTLKELGDKDLDIYVTMHIAGSQHPDAVDHAKSIVSKANNRTKQWLRKALASATEVDLVSEEGIILDKGIRFAFNTDRIIRTMELSVRGLHFWETRAMLPPDCPVTVDEVPWSIAPDFAVKRSQASPFTPTVKGKNVAWWKSFEVEGHGPDSKSWLICINNWVLYHGVTGELVPRGQAIREVSKARNEIRRQFEGLLVRSSRPRVTVPQSPDGHYLLPPKG